MVCYAGCCVYDPRPEFEPTRDPYPWDGVRVEGWKPQRISAAEGYRRTVRGESGPRGFAYAPRREEYDTPVNPLLTELRADSRPGAVSDLLDWLERYSKEGPVEGLDGKEIVLTKENIGHAKRVLTRLAHWSAE